MVKNKPVSGEGQSLEDVIISEYLEGLRTTHTAGAKPYKSPYEQRFPTSPYDGLLPPSRPSARGRTAPRSRSSSRSRAAPREAWEASESGGAQAAGRGPEEPPQEEPPPPPSRTEDDIVVIDVSAAAEEEDRPEEAREKAAPRNRRVRPGSAPVNGRRRLKDPASAQTQRKAMSSRLERSSLHSGSTASIASSGRPNSMRRRRKAPLYMRQPETLVVTAFRNGRRDIHCRIAAPSVPLLLEQATSKLELPSAARKVFLEDGTEVPRAALIPRDVEVYISMGEPFKNPYKPLRRIQELKEMSTWTMTGLQMPADHPRSFTKPKGMSKRFLEMNERKKSRILVFRNGSGTGAIEVVVDRDDFQGLLDACTAKLDIGSCARRIFLWDGSEVENLHEVPELHRLVAGGGGGSGGAPVLGPVWIAKAEGFSPSGCEVFLQDVIKAMLEKLKTSNTYREQLSFAQNNEKDKINLASILSLSEEEVDEAMNHVEEDIEEHRSVLREYREMRRQIADLAQEERDAGNEFTMRHIERVDGSSRLIGPKGLKIYAYENGSYEPTVPVEVYFNIREATRGFKAEGQNRDRLVLERFMDHLSNNCHLAAVNSQARGTLARRLFNRAGREVKVLSQVEDGMELWLSHGEAWIDPFTYCLNVDLHQVRRVERNRKVLALKEDASTVIESGMERPSNWEAVRGVPRRYQEGQEDEAPLFPENGEEASEDTSDPSEVGNDNYFLQYKKNPSVILFPEAGVSCKKRLNDTELFPSGTKCQSWLLNQDGNIFPKSLPHLALGVSDLPLCSRLPRGQPVSGFLLTFMPKNACDGLQRWNFEDDGRIYNVANPGLALTYLGIPLEKDDALPENSEENIPKGLQCTVGACEVIGGKAAKYQRWGIKQERFDILGQWKNNEVTNPEWSKRALTWPLDREGKLNEKLEWPMEGFLVPCAPPLEPKKPEGPPTMIPKRLFVLKNGMRETKKAVSVTGPDLTNMVKDRSLAKGRKKKGKGAEGGGGDSVDDLSLHCTSITLQQLEFQLFLERCTSLLALPNAARRIFDSRGVEHFSLQDLERDELIYVSSGDVWADPRLSKDEVRRRQLICLIADDVDRVRQFVQLRAPSKLVVAADGGLVAGMPLVVAPEIRRKRRRRPAAAENNTGQRSASATATRISSTDESSSTDSDQDALLNTLTAHERACQRGDERLNKLKWPWERIVNDNGLDDVVNVNEVVRSEDEKTADQKSFKKSFSPRVDPKQLQRFDFEDGFIFPRADPNLVLTVAEGEGRVLEVVLQKRRPDNVNQRWNIKPNGFIFAKYRHEQVLTVSMPKAPATAAQVDLEYPGSAVTLQPLKKVQFGRANQMFCFNPLNGLIHAFHASALDKEITAANTVNACTYSVLPDDIDQMGYSVFLPTADIKAKACHVCVACARALRGRYKLKKIEPGSLDFACSFGEAKRDKIREKGAWRCLSGKLDLSSSEAKATLEHWEETLRSLRQELTVKKVQSRLAESKTPRPVKVLAYHNGEGRLGHSELIVGSSMRGLMDQCQHRLGLPRAVRRLFTEDGTPMVDLEDLVTWYKANRQRVLLRQRQIQAGELAPEVEEMREEVAAMMEAAGESPGAEEGAGMGAEVSSSLEMADTDLEPQLNEDEGCYEIGRPHRKNAIYELCITVTELCKLEKLVPPTLLGDVHTSLLVTYCMFGEEIASDPFPNEAEFSAERTTIRLRASFSNLKLFFRHNFAQLRFDLHAVSADSNERMGLLGSAWVPLAALVPRDCPELFRPVSSEGIFPLYQPGSEPAPAVEAEGEERGTKSGAMICTEVKLAKEEKEEGEEEEEEGPRQPQGEAEAEAEARKEETVEDQEEEEEEHEPVPPPSEVGLEDMEAQLDKVVIEVWCSSGEAFVPLKTVYNEYLRTLKQRAARQGLSLELDTQKHVLRQMHARRLEGMQPGEFRATMDPENPVLIQGNWQRASTAERLKNDTLHNLQDRLEEIKAKQTEASARTRRPIVDEKRELYLQPSMTRVLVFPNGEDARRAVYVWGESLHQVLDNASMRLGLRKPGKWLYTMEGKRVHEFAELERDQLVCVSMGEAFTKAKEVHAQVEVRANWGRARRMYGAKATEVAVLSRPNAAVGVDPFGPPGLVRRPDPPPSFENKRVLVYENGKHRSDAVTVFADCLEALLANATRRLKLRKAAVCFYNSNGDKISHFDEVSRDEVLAVSTSGKSFIK